MSETYYFYKSIRRTIIQFLDMFNNIRIERYDTSGNVKGQYLVPIRYGPKSKAYLWVKDQGRDEEMLPMMSVYLTGIDFDPIRLTNKFQDIRVSDSSDTGLFAKNAMPFNIGFTLNIWALHMVDIDQIYEQILPYFSPHAFIRVKIPELNIAFDIKVVLTGCSPLMTDDVGEEEARVIKWDTTFTVQTWLFKPSLENIPLIGSINGVLGATAWSTGTLYPVGFLILGSDGSIYRCSTEHTSSAATYPITGASWETYWTLVEGYAWTSGAGTSGFSSSGTSGKIVNRYYTDLDTFEDRDNPIKEIYVDERPLETIAFRPVGVDDDARIILDYESYGENI
jgi:hypothetical protein